VGREPAVEVRPGRNGHHRLDSRRRGRCLGDPDHQRACLLAPSLPSGLLRHRRSTQAAPRSRAEPGRDRQGLCCARRQTLESVIKARNAAVTAQGPTAQAPAEVQLHGALRQIFALAEAYPDLKANQNLQRLRSELADLENKIERRGASSTTRRPNTMPRAQEAYLPCCSPQDFFNLDKAARATAVPPVKF